MTQFNQDLQDLKNLTKDPELAIFKAIKSVEKKVDNMCMEEDKPEEVIRIEII
jgi:hypothetical protein